MYQVLLVDDEPNITANMQKAIDWGSLQCEVAGIAESGREALHVIEERQVDIVIMPSIPTSRLSSSADMRNSPMYRGLSNMASWDTV